MGKRALRRLPLILVVVFVALLAWALVAALEARSDLVHARDRLVGLRNGETIDPDKLGTALDRAMHDVRTARHRLDAWGPALMSHVPLLGRSVVAERATSRVAAHVLDVSRTVLRQVTAPGRVVTGGRVDLDRLAVLESTLATAGRSLSDDRRRLRRLDTSWTPPQVGAGVLSARELVRTAADGFAHGAGLLHALGQVAGRDHPRHLLIVLQNNAELRGAGGLISVFAEAQASHGVLTVGKFRDVGDVVDKRKNARRVPAPADYVAQYGRYLANSTLWRNVNMSPDLPTSSEVLANLAQVSLKRRPDVVMSLDVPAISQLLKVVGPAVLPDGSQVTAKNAVEKLLIDAYRGVPDTEDGQNERRRRLRVAADAVVRRILSGGGTLQLARALAHAAAGRHLSLWSDVPDELSALEASSAAAHVRAGDPDLDMVTVQNLGGGGAEGNKLDVYARRSESVTVRVGKHRATVTRQFTLHNDSPTSGLTRYVAGLERPGQTRNLVQFALPADADVETFSRGDQNFDATASTEGDYHVLTDAVAIEPGAEVSWSLRYTVPIRNRHYGLRIVPQPLTQNAALVVDIRADKGVTLHRARGGDLHEDGFLDTERHFTMDVGNESVFGRLSRFWREPVL
jgi:hypothetical protein